MIKRKYFNKIFESILILKIYPTEASEVETELPLNLMDLPVELQLDIFEQLRFLDLISVSKALPEHRSLLEIVFRNILKNHAFAVVFIEGDKVRIYFAYTEIDIISERIATQYFEDILYFLQYFGHCIAKLKIDDYSNNATPQDVSLYERLDKQIREYVAKSVIEIEFHQMIHSTEFEMNRRLKDYIVPFPNCLIAKFHHGTIDAATLRQMFPVVNRLDLETATVTNYLPNFPHLKRLTVPKYWGAYLFDVSSFEQTLRANPQINHLSIPQYRYQWSLLQTLNRIQPDIESLEISPLSLSAREIIAAEPLRFANTTVLKCKAQDMDEFPLEFGNLEEIEFGNPDLFGPHDRAVNWTNILIQNKKLRKVTAINGLQRDQLERIANELPNLEEFTMKFDNRWKRE